MRREMMDIIVCPVCKQSLELNVIEEEGGDVVAGILRCKACGVEYPIEEGIPNLLPQTPDSERRMAGTGRNVNE